MATHEIKSNSGITLSPTASPQKHNVGFVANNLFIYNEDTVAAKISFSELEQFLVIPPESQVTLKDLPRFQRIWYSGTGTKLHVAFWRNEDR